jgi:predicted nucleic acid-binding protein
MQVLHSKLNVIPLSPEIAIHAGTLKLPGISVADAIIAASAASAGASVVTNDPHFSAMGVEITGYP